MGKKRRIRSGAGDFVPLPGALHRQIEGGRIAKNSRRVATRRQDESSDEEAKHGNELVSADLSSKILNVARIQIEDDEEGEVVKGGEDSADDYHAVEHDPELRRAKRVRFKSTTTDDLSQSEMQSVEKIPINTEGLRPEVVELYREVGVVLSQYSSGKIPKAFKVIPNLVNWEQILELTCPDNWTAAAMFQATRLFSSCMSPTMCQKFYSLILLPRIRDDIHENKRLNPHLYECLFKAIFKPAAFFKGILLPLCESGDCTLRGANIIGNVLKKISIPALHASAAMLKIAHMNYSPARSIFLRFLITKNYTLPLRVVEGIVGHFLRVKEESDSALPVLWHRCLLAFTETYCHEMSSEQKEALQQLVKVHSHPVITPVIRQYLQCMKSQDGKDQTNAHTGADEYEMEF